MKKFLTVLFCFAFILACGLAFARGGDKPEKMEGKGESAEGFRPDQ